LFRLIFRLQKTGDFINILFIKYYWNHKIKKHEMGGECSTHESDENCVRAFSLKTRTNLGDPSVDDG
jgi:hypothetical protein